MRLWNLTKDQIFKNKLRLFFAIFQVRASNLILQKMGWKLSSSFSQWDLISYVLSLNLAFPCIQTTAELSTIIFFKIFVIKFYQKSLLFPKFWWLKAFSHFSFLNSTMSWWYMRIKFPKFQFPILRRDPKILFHSGK